MMIRAWHIPEHELEWTAIRSSGPGGQHVNKVATGLHLRFDIGASGLPGALKQRLRALSDSRITRDGLIVIKSTGFRSREMNRQEALERLDQLLQEAQRVRKPRKKTRPTRASVRRRLDTKRRHGDRKRSRKPVDF